MSLRPDSPGGGRSDGQMLSANGTGSGSGSGSGSSHGQVPSTRRLSTSRQDLPSSDQKDGHQALRKSSSPPPKSPRAQNSPPAKSRFTKFFRWLFSPFANFFITIYNIFFRRIPKPKALLDEDQEAKMENRGPGASNINDRQTKENVNPRLNHAVANLTIRDAAAPVFPPVKSTVVPLVPVVPAGAPLKSVGIFEEEDEDPARKAERAIHQGFIEEALDMARLALKTNETPVGCVLVYRGRVIARGMNATNITRNGTRHAEYMALSSLFGTKPDAPPPSHPSCKHEVDDPGEWDAVDVTKSYLYPYGQKLHPSPHVTASIVQESTLYVTVEPCVMCASLLKQLKIKKVYFGAVNDKFGGTGGVFRIHKNSTSVKDTPSQPTRRVMGGRLMRVNRDGSRYSINALDDDTAPPTQHAGSSAGQQQYLQPTSSSVSSTGVMTPPSSASSPGPVRSMYQMGEHAQANQKWAINPKPAADAPTSHYEGDGGNVENGYEAEGGWGRDEAVTLLRQFYVQENGRAPVPRKKEGRAARLAALMEKDGMSPDIDLKVATNVPASAPATVAGTPVEEKDEDAAGMDMDGGGDVLEVPTPMSEVA
ncbi:hypothetical protein MGG_17933 [Pyricularia oryzae 70-15]|uniref:CMP/dCMP-type deaminase domain-containing protein n=3 Tax=Pyricularia oryzae TaxID=318829 RepID=G5EHU4_PYRO7|nr:uncharacterized protein MGG_17933 [Pyricularia oryzae 70-15]EAQ71263.1 hypothetical protein MGCH7_ch7g670 [Pyricularia oryzae 70-15]EHA46075.1 hypothetical protein MGG_17933 [Pyricularia oryzae 70-15]ELQ40205.1 tRNA-specific adenosine deaminase 2 [Pyricularia oryzae Y34]KAI7922148.1 hypothetical protein M0657_005768 [Pyricularia oryzae]